MRSISFEFAAVQFMFILLCLPFQVSSKVSSVEIEALLEFKRNLYHPEALKDWSVYKNESVCHWNGIACDSSQEHVISIRLRGSLVPTDIKNGWYTIKGLMGSITPKLEKLSHLQVLVLYDTDLTGPIPQLGHCQMLRRLVLSHNSLSGHIPESLGQLKMLTDMDLSFNQLSGHIPKSLGQLKMLKKMDLSINELSGRIPKSLGQLKMLTKMDLSSNELSGHIPETLGQLESLKQLSLNFNILAGHIPESLGQLMMLRMLDLSFNMLTGHIPKSFGQLKMLKSLSVGYNELSLSAWELTNATALEDLYLHKTLEYDDEFLKGLSRLPRLQILEIDGWVGWGEEDWGRLQTLEQLTIYDAHKIPQSLGQLSNLQRCEIKLVNYTAPIPASLGNCTSLRNLEVYNYGVGDEIQILNNRIPPSLGNCSKLSSLILYGLALVGSIPESFNQLSQLSELVLSDNRLSGGIESISSFHMNLLQLNNNNFSGHLRVLDRSMPNLKSLILDHNRFSGPVRAENWSSSLQEADLTHNLISGHIPWEICRLADLDVLSLSDNHLEGEIPSCLGNSSALEYLLLDSNHIEGSLPTSLSNCSDLKVIKVQRNNLHGSFLGKLSSNQYELRVDLSHNNFTGQILQVLPTNMSAVVFSSINLANNRMSGSIDAICSWKGAGSISLAYNMFTGGVPDCITNLTQLFLLDISNNALKGTLPRNLHGLTAFTVQLSHDLEDGLPELQYEAEELYEIAKGGTRRNISKILDELVVFDVSHNMLYGSIPVELGKLQNIRFLNLSNNFFSGSIPQQLGNLTNLTDLDLSNNKLSGEIPFSVAGILRLEFVNVSHNNLTGRVPGINSFNTRFDPSAFEGNPGLCGLPTNQTCESPGTVHAPDEDHEASFFSILAFEIAALLSFCFTLSLVLFTSCKLASVGFFFKKRKTGRM